MLTTMLRCTVCGALFPYRHDGRIWEDELKPIDRVCRACFPAWMTAWERTQGLTAPAEAPAPDAVS